MRPRAQTESEAAVSPAATLRPSAAKRPSADQKRAAAVSPPATLRASAAASGLPLKNCGPALPEKSAGSALPGESAGPALPGESAGPALPGESAGRSLSGGVSGSPGRVFGLPGRGRPREARRRPARLPCPAGCGVAASPRSGCGVQGCRGAARLREAACRRPPLGFPDPRNSWTRGERGLRDAAAYPRGQPGARVDRADAAKRPRCPQGCELASLPAKRAYCIGSGKLAGREARRREMRARAEAVFRRTLACPGHPAVFSRRPGPNEQAAAPPGR